MFQIIFKRVSSPFHVNGRVIVCNYFVFELVWFWYFKLRVYLQLYLHLFEEGFQAVQS